MEPNSSKSTKPSLASMFANSSRGSIDTVPYQQAKINNVKIDNSVASKNTSKRISPLKIPISPAPIQSSRTLLFWNTDPNIFEQDLNIWSETSYA